jgi:hypothetical protein
VSSAAIQAAVIAQLRVRPLSKGELRAVIGCTAVELAGAVQALRYQGKLAWDRLELSPSMLAQQSEPLPGPELAANGGGEEPLQQSAGAPVPAAEDGGQGACDLPPSSDPAALTPLEVARKHGFGGSGEVIDPDEPDDREDPYPGGVNDAGPEEPATVPAAVKPPGGWTKAANVGGARAVPAPSHEPEIARLVREEVNDLAARRRLARSTGTVRQPLEARRFGIPDLGAGEAVATLLVETPHDLAVAINRKHPALWKRIVMLARVRGERPAQCLYAALEAGLDQLDPQQEQAA